MRWKAAAQVVGRSHLRPRFIGAPMTRVKLNALTGLRIVAAGMIVVHHSRALQIPVPNYSLDHGVSFFFVLSGFIIAYAYPSLDSKGDVLRFFAARFARIWPAHIVALLLVLVCLQQPLDKTIVANAFLVHGWIPSWPWYFSYNAPSWSISTECFFYVAFVPLIFRWTASWWWKWIGSLVLVFVLIKIGVLLNLPALSKNDEPTLHGLLYVSPLARLFEFTTGMVVCLAFGNIEPMSRAINHNVFGWSPSRAFPSSLMLPQLFSLHILVVPEYNGLGIRAMY